MIGPEGIALWRGGHEVVKHFYGRYIWEALARFAIYERMDGPVPRMLF